MPTIVLQDWTTIRGSSVGAATVPVTQPASDWCDAEDFADVTFFLDVREVTNPGSGTMTLAYETAPTRDESLFQTIARVGALAPVSPRVSPVLMNAGPVLPLSKWVRWRLIPSTTGTWDVTFRVLATFGYGTSGAICPLSIPGSILWLRADRGVTLASGRVSTWADQSGHGRDLSQANTAHQPLWVDGDLNGQPTISFDKTRIDYLAAAANLDMTVYTGMTTAAVVNYQNAQFGMFVAQASYDELREYNTTNALALATFGLDNCHGTVDRSNTWLVVIGTHLGSTNALEVRRFKTSEATASSGGALGSAPLAVGARWDGVNATWPLAGKLAEAVIWNRQLSQAECDLYASYAIARWNLTPT